MPKCIVFKFHSVKFIQMLKLSAEINVLWTFIAKYPVLNKVFLSTT